MDDDIINLEEITLILARSPLSIPSNPGPQNDAEDFKLNMSMWRATSVQAIKGLSKEIGLLRGDVKDLGDKVDDKFERTEDKCGEHMRDVNLRFGKVWDKVHSIDVRVAGIAAVISIATPVIIKVMGG